MTTRETFDRRTVLKATGATALGLSLSGCVGGLFDGSTGATDDVVLDEPERYDQLREHRDAGEITHPIHADELPEARTACAIHGADVGTMDFVDDRHTVYTFIFSRCPSACLVLTANVAHVQVAAIDGGYDDEIAALPVTFDPEYDSRDVLRAYSEDRGAAVDDGSWYFLRPETESEAEQFVKDAFGVHYEPLTEKQREEMDMHEDMAFLHEEVIVLANADGYVERTYFGDETTDEVAILDDVNTLVERW